MKKLMTISLTALVLFGASAGISWWLHKGSALAEEPVPAPDEAAKSNPESSTKNRSTASGARPAEPGLQRAAARVPYSPAAEEAVQLANGLRDRLAAVREHESQVNAREKQMELVLEDIRGERSAIDALRKTLNDELKAADDRISTIEQKRAEVEEQGKAVSTKVKEMEARVLRMGEMENGNVHKIAEVVNTMAPESTAKILQQLADTGKIDTSVKLLSCMKPAQAAKVLAELSDPGLAAQFVEKLKDLQKSPATTKK
jgi:flagellar motility protein MotE (MotC chaperone)